MSSSRTPARHAPLGLALLAAMSCACAQDATPIVVTGNRIPQPLTDALPHTTLLTRAEIERSQAVDLPSLIARESGVEFASNGGRGTATSLFVRGAQNRQVLVLIDGVPLARHDATGQVGIEHLMLDQIDRIEIVRGNLSAVYGSGAVGGVIQVFTREGRGPARASAHVEAGSQGFAHGSASVGGGTASTQWSLGLSAQRTRGQSAIDPAVFTSVNPDRDGYRNTSAVAHVAHDWAPGQRLSAGLMMVDGKTAYDSTFATPDDTQDSRSRKTVLRLGSENEFGTAGTTSVQLSRQRERFDDATTGTYGYVSRYTTEVDTLNWTHRFVPVAGVQAQGGVELQRQRIDGDDGYGGGYVDGRDVTALFGGAQGKLGAHTLGLNLRHDRIQGGDAQTTGRADWAWAFAAGWRVNASLATSFAVAPLGYLYAPYFGNPDLKAEHARSREVGLQWTSGRQVVRATLFDNRVRDEISYDFGSQKFENIGRTRNRGLELSYSGRIGATDLRASLTSQDPTDLATGTRLLRRAAFLASTTVSHDLGGGWRVGGALRHAGARPDAGNVTLDAYTVADLTAQWDVSPQWQALARVENLGDVAWQTANGYPQPGRGVFVGLRWRGGL